MQKPVLQAMVLADHVYRDGTTGKCIIAGTFTRYLIRKPPSQPAEGSSGITDESTSNLGPQTRAGTPFLYFALVEVHGTIPLVLKFIDLSDASVLFEASFIAKSNDPIVISEYVIPMPEQILGHKPGNYSLDLLHDNEILGQWRIIVSLED